MSGIIIYGDPHGEWGPLLQACATDKPDGVVILGDCDLSRPLREEIAPLFDAGIRVRWIPGNHDADTLKMHDRLWGDYPEGSLHGRWVDLGGMVVAGLGGVFKASVWYPRYERAEPVHRDRRTYLRQLQRSDQWRHGLPLRLRDAIFPEDVEALSNLRVDILVTHEAPTSHKSGFVGIDDAATRCRARLVVHGHHHVNYSGVTAGGIPVRGLAKAEVLRLRREDLP